MCQGASALLLGQKGKSHSLLPVLSWFVQLFRCVVKRILLLPKENISQLLQLLPLSEFPDVWKLCEWDENLSYHASRILIGSCKPGFVLLNIYRAAKPKHSKIMSQVVWKSWLTQKSRAFQNNKCQSIFFNVWFMNISDSDLQFFSTSIVNGILCNYNFFRWKLGSMNWCEARHWSLEENAKHQDMCDKTIGTEGMGFNVFFHLFLFFMCSHHSVVLCLPGSKPT